MTALKIAQRLLETSPEKREQFLDDLIELPAVEIAASLQEICFEVWTVAPQKVKAIVESLNALVERTNNAEVKAYAKWAEAIEHLVRGDLEQCIGSLDRSEQQFLKIGNCNSAARTQPSKLYALALLGRYDEAVECGVRARQVFIENGDLYSTGKIEHNIGNLYWRRDMYRESEPYLSSAHERFLQIDDQRQLAMVENCQAFVLTLQNHFHEAEPIYLRALERTKKHEFKVTEAEIEVGLSNLYLFQGKYDQALRCLEQARKTYEELDLPNQSSVCELEIADLYLELNLLDEAANFYEKVGERLEFLGMQAELARCLLGHSRASMLKGDTAGSAEKLDRAEILFANEGNSVASGSVFLARAQIDLLQGNLDDAERQIELAIASFRSGGSLRQEFLARWLKSEIFQRANRSDEALAQLRELLDATVEYASPVEFLCRVSIGKAALDRSQFLAAIDIVENSRAMLVSDELRISYFSDKLVPYNELVKYYLANNDPRQAFYWHERSRSRALVESIEIKPGMSNSPDSDLKRIREELNWLYRRINSTDLSSPNERRSAAAFRQMAKELENDLSETKRRNDIADGPSVSSIKSHDIERTMSGLGNKVIVEFAVIDGQVSAFVISKNEFAAFPNYADGSEIKEAVKQLLFQLNAGRIADRLSSENQRIARNRLLTYSQKIYNILLRPLETTLNGQHIVFIPAGDMNRLPFQAMHDGEKYLVEAFDISYSPSLAMLENCIDRPVSESPRALFAGVADERAPLVEAEIGSLKLHFEKHSVLVNEMATVGNFQKHIGDADLIHIACHGKFRSDNPEFSSLSFFDADLTVQELRSLSIKNSIIVLSACESGVNRVVDGEELIGLTNGFFRAGASSLILSLWKVDDQAAFDFMNRFYTEFCQGKGLATALRTSQCELIDQDKHPYFWSPFVISGNC